MGWRCARAAQDLAGPPAADAQNSVLVLCEGLSTALLHNPVSLGCLSLWQTHRKSSVSFGDFSPQPLSPPLGASGGALSSRRNTTAHLAASRKKGGQGQCTLQSQAPVTSPSHTHLLTSPLSPGAAEAGGDASGGDHGLYQWAALQKLTFHRERVDDLPQGGETRVGSAPWPLTPQLCAP